MRCGTPTFLPLSPPFRWAPAALETESSMGLSIWHVLIVLVIVLVLFGAGKLPRVMGDLAKGIKSFKEGLKDEPSPEPKSVSDSGAARSSESESRNEAHKS